jgi:hypothetical protein
MAAALQLASQRLLDCRTQQQRPLMLTVPLQVSVAAAAAGQRRFLCSLLPKPLPLPLLVVGPLLIRVVPHYVAPLLGFCARMC